MGKPSCKPFPGSSFPVFFFSQNGTVLFVVVEKLGQFIGYRQVHDERIDFIVVTDASAVHVHAAYGTETVVYHHDFGMMKTSVEDIDMCSFFA